MRTLYLVNVGTTNFYRMSTTDTHDINDIVRVCGKIGRIVGVIPNQPYLTISL